MTDISPPPGAVPPPPPARVAAIRKFTCPNCGGEIQIRAGGHTLTAVCAHCSSVIDVADERLKVIQEVNSKTMRTFLEIGQRGKMKGVTWEVVGYTQKSDKTKVYYWEEYLIFNPYHGFRFIVHMDGHWNFVTMIKRDIEKMGFVCTIWLDDNKFDPFLQDEPIVQYVKGEFYWRVKKGDRARTEDYVCPPYMLSFEYSDGDMVASLCEYVEPDVIKQAFAVQQDMPVRKGVGPNQPSPVEGKGVAKVAVLAVAILTLLHFINLGVAKNQVVVSLQATHQAGDQTGTFTTEPFEIPKTSNVLIDSYASVSNSWVELNVSLVNENTKEEIEVNQPIEYYFGSDSDGPWSEGSTRASDYMSEVPAGFYRLVYDIDADGFTASAPSSYVLGGSANPAYVASNGHPVNIAIKATRDVASWGNYLFTLLMLLLCPLYTMMRNSAFENRRWENSDFPRTGDDE